MRGNELHRMRGMHRHARRDAAAGIHAAGHVQRQHRHAGGIDG
jgi:hypothetical protein